MVTAFKHGFCVLHTPQSTRAGTMLVAKVRSVTRPLINKLTATLQLLTTDNCRADGFLFPVRYTPAAARYLHVGSMLKAVLTGSTKQV
jgi:hypothetical protein